MKNKSQEKKNRTKQKAGRMVWKKRSGPSAQPVAPVKDFIDMIAPTAIRFEQGRYVSGNTWRCVWAIRAYPTTTEEPALLRHLGEMAGVTLHIYTRLVPRAEEGRILHDADKANKLRRSNTENLRDIIMAESNLQDMAQVMTRAQREHESFLHTAVYIDLAAADPDQLKQLQETVSAELSAAKINVDRLILRQQTGYLCVMPSGWNAFGQEFERMLPASSAANLYPLAYSGKTDPQGSYIGHDKYGSSVIVDLDRRTPDKTNGNVLILGNSGQGKSYLMKLLVLCELQAGKSGIILDPESEYEDLTRALDGCYIDLMSGQYKINVLEPRRWAADAAAEDTDGPVAFRAGTVLSQHISFLRDFFRSYKSFSDGEIDTIELLLDQLYSQRGISDSVNLAALCPADYPTLADLHDLALQQLDRDDPDALYTHEQLRAVALGLHSMCKGAESKFFNGHTNITSSRLLTFGVKGLLEASANVRNAMLFNVLSYMSGTLLTRGNSFAAIDELYLFLSNPIAIEYLRNAIKRVRKRDSAVLLASQNVEDFLQPGVAEMTKPLFSIPAHQFLFNAGTVSKAAFMDTLQLEDAEYEIIRSSQRGQCLYKCGNERYNLVVCAPPHKEALCRSGGGR